MSETPLTARIRTGQEPPDLAACEAAGGYQALRRALGTMTPEQVTAEVTHARLRGRGGAGFPTGTKWSFVPTGADAPQPKYLVVNADEMEPGTFKDRLLLEGDPHQLLEGVLCSAYAIGASVAYIFLRAEYRLAELRLERALAEAAAAGYLGRDILGSGFSLEVHLHTSAGRYICGEESALLTPLEGRPALPRAKPPFPPVVGLWGKPTVVNNVETLCNVPHIVEHGGDWFLGLSRTRDGGTKVYGVSGRVRRPGAFELPLGTTMRELLDVHAGGMRDGLRCRALLPGGASTDFVLERDLDLPLDFESLAPVGSRMGTGTMIALDDRTCPVGMVRNLVHFFAQESCGWCTPCWAGLSWAERILEALETGEGRGEDLERLAELPGQLALGHTFCALAPGAVEPLGSALTHFRADFQRHVDERRCPWR